MSALTSKERNKLPGKDFAVPGRHYPIDTANRARSALSRVAHNGSPTEKAEVRRKVHARYPGIAVSGIKKGGKSRGQRKRAGRKA